MPFDSSFFASLCVLKTGTLPCLASNWACELLEQGFDTSNLRILAGLEDNGGYDLIRKVLEELNVAFPSEENARKIYFTGILSGYLQQRITSRELISELVDIYQKNENCDLLYPFYLLYCEIPNQIDLLLRETPEQTFSGCYYEKLRGVSFDKFEDYVHFEAKSFLNFLENGKPELVHEQLNAIRF